MVLLGRGENKRLAKWSLAPRNVEWLEACVCRPKGVTSTVKFYWHAVPWLFLVKLAPPKTTPFWSGQETGAASLTTKTFSSTHPLHGDGVK